MPSIYYRSERKSEVRNWLCRARGEDCFEKYFSFFDDVEWDARHCLTLWMEITVIKN